MDIGENIFTRRAAPLCFCQGSWSSPSVSSLLTISPFTVFLPVVFPHDWAEPPLVLLAEPPPVPQALLGLLTLSSVQDLHSAQGGLIHLAPFSPSFPKAHIFGQSSSSGVVTREGSQKDSAPVGHWGHWDTTPDMDVHPGVPLVPVEAALMGPSQPSPEVDPGAPQCSGGHSWERNMSQLSPKSTGWSEMADGTMGGHNKGHRQPWSWELWSPCQASSHLVSLAQRGDMLSPSRNSWVGHSAPLCSTPRAAQSLTAGTQQDAPAAEQWILDLPFDSRMVRIWMGLTVQPVPLCSRARLKSCSYSGESCWLIPSPERTVSVTGG